MPTSCNSCGTSVPDGASRCPGCGRVFGEANRCPTCHAVAAVERTSAGYVCAACRAPRELRDGTVVHEDTGLALPGSNAPHVKSLAARGGAFALRLLGGGIVGLGALATFTTLVFGHGSVAEPALVEALLTLAAGGSFFGLGHLVDRRARSHAAASLELRILDLAAKQGGELYATDVARALGIASTDAEAALSRLADGTRVTVEVTDDGLLKYVFRELAARASVPRVRVEAADPDEVEVSSDPSGTHHERDRS